MVDQVTIVKVGGNELDDATFLARLYSTLGTLNQSLILVHGGGKEISAALERYSQPVRFVDGLRVTPPESMAVMEMVVCGSINKRLVAGFTQAGIRALGLSGVDLGMLRCVQYRPNGVDLGRVGTVTAVDVAVLRSLLSLGWLPVIAPVALGQEDGLTYNVNADHVAQAVAAALATSGIDTVTTELVFVSNVPGVMLDGQVAAHLTAGDIERGIATGAIVGGMIPKVRSALAALEMGVTSVRITNLDGLAHAGTRIAYHQPTSAGSQSLCG